MRDSQQLWTQDSTAAAKAGCVTTAVSTSVDPALWCLVTGAELGCSFGSDRLESSWKGNVLRSRNQGPNLPKTLPRATEHNQGRRAGTSHLRKRTQTWEQGWTIGARAAQGYPLLIHLARWHFTASSFSTQVPLIYIPLIPLLEQGELNGPHSFLGEAL